VQHSAVPPPARLAPSNGARAPMSGHCARRFSPSVCSCGFPGRRGSCCISPLAAEFGRCRTLGSAADARARRARGRRVFSSGGLSGHPQALGQCAQSPSAQRRNAARATPPGNPQEHTEGENRRAQCRDIGARAHCSAPGGQGEARQSAARKLSRRRPRGPQRHLPQRHQPAHPRGHVFAGSVAPAMFLMSVARAAVRAPGAPQIDAAKRRF